ncbi:MAG: zf-HC2 domain-containing protein [Clostridia bacterium]|nr:zf-HC2 domain-containing protein [Clostridia bacterium]
MNCHEFEEKLDGLIDEELPEEEQRRCREHTEICSHCREKETQYRRIRQAALATSCQAPPELASAVEARLGFARRKRSKPWVGAVASAAVLALLAGGGYGLWQATLLADDSLSDPNKEQINGNWQTDPLMPVPEEAEPPANILDEEKLDGFWKEPGAIYPFVVKVICPPEKREQASQTLFEGMQTLETGGGRMICRADLELLYQRVSQDPFLNCDRAVQPMPEGTVPDVLVVLVTAE